MWVKEKSEREQITCEPVIREPVIILSKNLEIYKIVPGQ